MVGLGDSTVWVCSYAYLLFGFLSSFLWCCVDGFHKIWEIEFCLLKKFLIKNVESYVESVRPSKHFVKYICTGLLCDSCFSVLGQNLQLCLYTGKYGSKKSYSGKFYVVKGFGIFSPLQKNFYWFNLRMNVNVFLTLRRRRSP